MRWRQDGSNKARAFNSEKGARDWRRLLDAAGPSVALAALEVDDAQGVGTVGELVSRHIDHLTGVTEGTRKAYRSYLTRDMASLSEIPAPALDGDAVRLWVNGLQGRGLSGKSIANRHGLLSAALQGAVDARTVPANPCRGVRLPRADGHEMVFLTREEFAEVYALLAAHWQPLALTLVGTGMRFGEATALQVRDVSLRDRTIRVRQAWKHTGSRRRELGPPKTKRAKRTVRAPSQVSDALAVLMAGRRPDAFVFTTTRGDSVQQPTFWRPWNRAAKEWATDPERVPRPHDLRHTFASWAIQSGIPLPVIQRTLGHESITTTIDRYGHLAAADFDALADATGLNLPKPSRQIGR